MAFPKDWLGFDIWNRTRTIWLLSLMNLLLNALSVYLLWVIANRIELLASHGAAAASAGTQQIAVVSGGGGS
jgi:flagellar basal body-associated protein FliL